MLIMKLQINEREEFFNISNRMKRLSSKVWKKMKKKFLNNNILAGTQP